MNEPKKRGRPTNAERAARQAAITEPVINGDTSREPEDVLPVKAKFSTFDPKPGSGQAIRPGEVVQVYRDPFDVRLAQAYALRVWNGQSPDVPRNERLKRVAKALEGQGLSMEGVEL